MMEPQMQDQPTPVLERLLTSAEVAEALQISPSTLCRWRQVGHGPRVTWLTPFSPRYQREDVAAWVKRSAA